MRLLVRHLGLKPYVPVWRAMQQFTDQRSDATPSEIWLVEHPPVFTQGQAGKAEHVIEPGDIPVIQTDRGGQVTYHGPGQLVVYLLLELKETGKGIRGLVSAMEDAVVALLSAHGVQARARRDAPGVYVAGDKVAALGLRVRRGYTYHGLALNVAMDLQPFSRINPCGYPDQGVTQLQDLGIELTLDQAGAAVVNLLAGQLGYLPEWSQEPPCGLGKPKEF